MKTIIAWIKSVRFLAWGLVAVGTVVLIWLARNLFNGPTPTGQTTRIPEVPPALQTKVQNAEEQATKAKIEAKVAAQADIEELERICKITEGSERRKRLADLLRRL